MATAVTKRNVGIWHLIAGLIMAGLGIYVWFNPVVSLMALAMYLGVVFIIVGAGYLTFSFNVESGWYLLVGVLDLLVGIVFVTNIGVTAASLPIIFALWCLAVGAIQVVSAYREKKAGLPWGWSLSVGILGIVFAFMILAYPALGAITITALMGAYILLYGIVEIMEYAYNRRLMVAA